MMVRAGFDSVFIGIETPSEESLAECNKQQNKNRDLIESVKIMQRAGLQVQGGFMSVSTATPFHLSEADRVYPEERNRDGHGRPAECPSRHETL